ncbi:copper homeostasis protein CutC [Ferruginibacter yonginensis]|uniref:PF03932 family protein CutC n=1 Tax=Ferruginibacter yonginensis TaxID=1310416 RepID=A0ABV8QNL6_9BACT
MLETIAFNIESCTIAQAAGADRIELCANPGEGGTTPSAGFIKQARRLLSIDLFPIIRPRGGDFLYTADELAVMKSDILLCKNAGCDGVVLGVLQADGHINQSICSALVALAYPMSVTFHRAFDRVADPSTALEAIIDCGFERILTSGGRPTAMEGIDALTWLVTQANNRIIIMPGSGVRANNIAQIKTITGATEFHSSARKMFVSNMQYQNTLMNEQLLTTGIDAHEITQMQQLLKNDTASL